MEFLHSKVQGSHLNVILKLISEPNIGLTVYLIYNCLISVWNLGMCTGSMMVKLSTLQKYFMLVLYGRCVHRVLISHFYYFIDPSQRTNNLQSLPCMQVSVQAFNDEDPQGRRTLGIIFIHPFML